MYSAKEYEKKIAAYWEKEKTYEQLKKRNEKGEKFYFCDGPPYATGQIHPGTAWNKSLKDAMCRFWRARGRNVRAKPGYDTHGLPIEVKVEQELGIKNKREIEEKIGIEKFIDKCKAFATQYIGVMGGQFQRCGVWMDWEDPYITYKDRFIERSWATIKKAHEKKLLYRGVYVLPLCPRCETTMANYELEYDEADDPSVYVKFALKGKNEKEPEYLIIWTTTPWTLVANMAVMVHPEYKYVRAKVGDEVWIVAKERLDALMALTHELGLSAIVLGEMAGKKLEGAEYVHPLAEKVPRHKNLKHKVVLSDEFVTLEEGTGLVHCAPGHGPQDFIIGKRYGLEIFCPVGANGVYTAEAGELAGKHIKKANAEILEYLKEKGVVVHAGKIRHRAAHCWRCKTHLIYVATDQWFIAISKVKEQMLAEVEKIRWQPEHARTWFRDFVGNAPDWCISRQRFWGIPLPIWICTNDACKETKVIGSAAELPKKLDDLHKPQIDAVEFECAKCKSKMKRTPDVLDVWFDSGNAIWASLEDDEEEKKWYPADFITEGKDQIRGWFYSLLGSGIVMNNEIPYKSILMHGFFMDEKGEKMSKSVGNFVPLEEILDKHGADAFRLWSLSTTVWDDLRFNWNELKEAGGIVGVLWNLQVYLDRFYVKPKKEDEIAYRIEDMWLLSRMHEVTKDATASFEALKPHEAAYALRKFVSEDLSRFYLKVAKKRVADGEDAEGALDALYQAVRAANVLMMPFVPFVTEANWQAFFRKHEKEESAALAPWPSFDASRIDPLLEAQVKMAEDIVACVANARQVAAVKLRWPVSEAVVESDSSEVAAAVQRLSTVICSLANVKGARVVPKGSPPAGYASADFSEGKAWINPKLDAALYSEAMGRELVRRVQSMRKEMGLVEKDEVSVHVCAPKEFVALVEAQRAYVSKAVNASKVELKEGAKLAGSTSWDIEEWKVLVKVAKA